MPQRNIVNRVVDWLTVGYPQDVPPQDRAAVMAVLSKRLTDEQLHEVIRRLMQIRNERGEEYVSDERINEYIRKVVDDVQSPQEIDRVARILGAHGLLISESHFDPEEPVEESSVEGFVKYEEPTAEEVEIAEEIASELEQQ